MKKVFIMVLALNCLYAQNGIEINGMSSAQLGITQGSGMVVEKRFTLQPFRKIDADVSVDITVQKSNKYEYTIKGDDNIVGLIEVKPHGDTLIIRSKKSYQTNSEITLLIKTKQLESLELEGSTTAKLKGLNEKHLTLTMDGSIDLTASSGRIGDLKIDSDGAYDVDLTQINVKNAEVTMEGSGDVQLNVSDYLHATVRDNASLIYKGSARVKRDISDNGFIEKNE